MSYFRKRVKRNREAKMEIIKNIIKDYDEGTGTLEFYCNKNGITKTTFYRLKSLMENDKTNQNDIFVSKKKSKSKRVFSDEKPDFSPTSSNNTILPPKGIDWNKIDKIERIPSTTAHKKKKKKKKPSNNDNLVDEMLSKHIDKI